MARTATRTSARSRRTNTRTARTCASAAATGPTWRNTVRAAAAARFRGWNENIRYTFEDSLSWTKGPHNFKFGFSRRADARRSPARTTYNGVYNFGHNADNPLSTGNGYANALLGVFTSYQERDDRIDRERRHWQWDAYAQDSWRVNSRLTLDYGFRVTHHGALYEVRDMNSAFDPGLWDPSQAAGSLPAVLPAERRTAGTRRARPPTGGPSTRSPDEIVSHAFAGTVVPGSGDIANGHVRRAGCPARRPAGTTTCRRSRGRRGSGWRGT